MRRTVLGLVLLGLSAAAQADEFDYTYLSLGWGNVEFDDVNADGSGFRLDGALALTEYLHLFADYALTDLDFGVDATEFGAGLGYNTSITHTIDLVARLSYEYLEVEAGGFGSADDNGLGLGLGLRYEATPELELNAGLDYIDYSDSGDETALGLGGLYNFTDAFAVGLGGNWSDDASWYTLSGRYYFDY